LKKKLETYPGLPEAFKTQYQEKLAHFIRNLENRHGKENVIEYFGIVKERYSDIRSVRRPHPRFINSIEFLDKIASANRLELWDFLKIVQGDSDQLAGENKQKPVKIDEQVLVVLERIDLEVKNRFIKFCLDAKRDISRFERILKIALELDEMDLDVAEKVMETLRTVKFKYGDHE